MPEITFVFKTFFSANLHNSSQHCIMVIAISITTPNENVICNAKYIWHILEYFIYFCWNMHPAGAAVNGNFV